MVLHDTSHKPTATLRRFAANFACQIVFECSCQHCSTIRFLRTHAPCRSFTFLLNVGTEFAEYKCQSVSSPVSKGSFTHLVLQGDQASRCSPGLTKLGSEMGNTERRLGVYLQSASQAVTLLLHGLFHGPSCFHPQTLVLQLRHATRSPPLSSAVTHQQLVQPFK